MEPNNVASCVSKGKSEVCIQLNHHNFCCCQTYKERYIFYVLFTRLSKYNQFSFYPFYNIYLSNLFFSFQFYDCRNHIRVIQPIGTDSNKLYLCGTNAHNPKDWVINVCNSFYQFYHLVHLTEILFI